MLCWFRPLGAFVAERVGWPIRLFFFHNKKSESRPSIHSLVGDLIGKEADGET
jgi:hypothetical protein